MLLPLLAFRLAFLVVLVTATCPRRRNKRSAENAEPLQSSCAPPVKRYSPRLQEYMQQAEQTWISSKLGKLSLTARQNAWFASLKGRSDDVRMSEMNEKETSSSYVDDTSCGIGKIGLRREYRQLSRDERQRFHRALNKMKSTYPDPAAKVSEYDIFVKYHRFAEAPAAHFGAAFLGWHREFLWRFESALRTHEHGVFLPYWDATLDQALPRPSHAAIWTDDYMGNNDGLVTSGSFAYWGVIPECHGNGTRLTRNTIPGPSRGCIGCGYGAGYGGTFFGGSGSSMNGGMSHYTAGDPSKPSPYTSDDTASTDPPAPDELLFSDADIDYILSKTTMAEIATGQNPKFEADHGLVHTYVGGHMGNIECSPCDPIFWLHHSFVDNIWEEFRQNSQRSERQTEYPSGNIGGSAHAAHAPMLPFWPLINAHGLSDHYTNYYYRYAPRPRACTQDEHCGSDLIWCDPMSCRCRAKVRMGGDCTGLPNRACAGKCAHNRRPVCAHASPYSKCMCPPMQTFPTAKNPTYNDDNNYNPNAQHPDVKYPSTSGSRGTFKPSSSFVPSHGEADYVPDVRVPTHGMVPRTAHPSYQGGSSVYGSPPASNYNNPASSSHGGGGRTPTSGYRPTTNYKPPTHRYNF